MPVVRRLVSQPCPAPLHRLAAAIALAAAQLGASAQQAAPPDAAASAPEAGKLPTVTVTAERRRENIRDVPNSVSTIGAELLAYVRNITDQIRIVGGIDFNNLTGFINEPRTYGVQFKAAF